MAQTPIDTFTDTDGTAVTSHTAGGITWTTWTPPSANAGVIRGNRWQSNNAGLGAVYVANTLNAESVYAISTFYVASQNGGSAGHYLRAASGAFTAYEGAYQDGTSGVWTMTKWSAGSRTVLGSSTVTRLSVGTSTVCLTNVTPAVKQTYANGTLVASSTDDSITGSTSSRTVSFQYIGASSPAVGVQVDDFFASDGVRATPRIASPAVTRSATR